MLTCLTALGLALLPDAKGLNAFDIRRKKGN